MDKNEITGTVIWLDIKDSPAWKEPYIYVKKDEVYAVILKDEKKYGGDRFKIFEELDGKRVRATGNFDLKYRVGSVEDVYAV